MDQEANVAPVDEKAKAVVMALPEPPEDLPAYLRELFGEISTRVTAILVKLALLEHKASQAQRTIEDHERTMSQCPKCSSSLTPKSPHSSITRGGPL